MPCLGIPVGWDGLTVDDRLKVRVDRTLCSLIDEGARAGMVAEEVGLLCRSRHGVGERRERTYIRQGEAETVLLRHLYLSNDALHLRGDEVAVRRRRVGDSRLDGGGAVGGLGGLDEALLVDDVEEAIAPHRLVGGEVGLGKAEILRAHQHGIGGGDALLERQLKACGVVLTTDTGCECGLTEESHARHGDLHIGDLTLAGTLCRGDIRILAVGYGTHSLARETRRHAEAQHRGSLGTVRLLHSAHRGVAAGEYRERQGEEGCGSHRMSEQFIHKSYKASFLIVGRWAVKPACPMPAKRRT